MWSMKCLKSGVLPPRQGGVKSHNTLKVGYYHIAKPLPSVLEEEEIKPKLALSAARRREGSFKSYGRFFVIFLERGKVGQVLFLRLERCSTIYLKTTIRGRG